MKISREIKTGILIVVAVAISVYGLNYLKGYDLFSTSDEYYAVYKDANGLLESNPILINGMRVGKIQRIYFHPDNSGRVVVKFMLSNTDFKISKDAKALVASLDLLGAKGIRIVQGISTVFFNNGDTITTGIEEALTDKISKELMPTKYKAENLISQIDSTLQQVNGVLNNGGSNSLKQILTNLSNTTSGIDKLVSSEQAKLSKILSDAAAITNNIKNNEASLTAALSNVAQITDSLAKSNLKNTILTADKSLNELAATLNKINSGKGTVGMLIHNDSLYKNLDASAKSLDRLLIDLKENPKRYVHLSVFGKK